MAKRRANGEGSLRKRKDGRWEGRYTAGTDPATGKAIVKSVLGKTQAEVKEKLKKAIAESGELDIKRSGLYTVGEWMDLWYEIYPACWGTAVQGSPLPPTPTLQIRCRNRPQQKWDAC